MYLLNKYHLVKFIRPTYLSFNFNLFQPNIIIDNVETRWHLSLKTKFPPKSPKFEKFSQNQDKKVRYHPKKKSPQIPYPS